MLNNQCTQDCLQYIFLLSICTAFVFLFDFLFLFIFFQLSLVWSKNYGGIKPEASLEQQPVEISSETISSSKKSEASSIKLRKRFVLVLSLGLGSLITVLVPILVVTFLPKAGKI